MKSVDIAAVALDSDSGAPVVVLREQDAPHRLLPIVIGASDAAAIAYPASGRVPDRPLTADLLTNVLAHLDAKIDNVEVTELRDGAFHALLNVRTVDGAIAIDARPSDAIAVALRVHAPVLVSEAVLDEAASLPPEDDDEPAIDQQAIEETVEEFREFLDELDPARFAVDEPTESCSDDDEVIEDAEIIDDEDDD